MKKIIPSDLDAQRSHDRLFLTLLIGCAFLLSSLTFAAITQFWAGPPYAPLMANALSILTGIVVLIGGQYLRAKRLKPHIDKAQHNKEKQKMIDIVNAYASIHTNISKQIKTIMALCTDNEKRHLCQEDTLTLDNALGKLSLLDKYIYTLTNTQKRMIRPSEFKKKDSTLRTHIISVLEQTEKTARCNNINLYYEIDSNIPERAYIDIKNTLLLLQNGLQQALVHTHQNRIFVKISRGISSPDKNVIKIWVIDGSIQSQELAPPSLSVDSGKGITNPAIMGRNDTGTSFHITAMLATHIGGALKYTARQNHGFSLQIEVPYEELSRPTTQNDFTALSQIKKFKTKKIQNILHARPERPPSTELPNILIVDDHPANLMLMHKFISTLKCKTVDDAPSGRQAISQYKKNKYDIIFMDCQMPDIDGFSACKVIRHHEAEHALPPAIIVGVTADMTRMTRKKCLESGMNDNVYKPLTQETLTTTMARYMPHAIDYEKISHLRSEEILAKTYRNTTSSKSASLKSPQLPVNLSHIRSYTNGQDDSATNKEEEKILFSLFIEQAKNSVEALKVNLETHNPIGWCHAAHKLKGSSANLGAEQLAELCQMAEYHDSGIDDEDILRAIQAEFDKVDIFLNDLMEDSKDNQNRHIH
tara:strand:+ start:143737 stop:145674 length:1938 start_codon:yes stop_codon:yes gene_type:complete